MQAKVLLIMSITMTGHSFLKISVNKQHVILNEVITSECYYEAFNIKIKLDSVIILF